MKKFFLMLVLIVIGTNCYSHTIKCTAVFADENVEVSLNTDSLLLSTKSSLGVLQRGYADYYFKPTNGIDNYANRSGTYGGDTIRVWVNPSEPGRQGFCRSNDVCAICK